MNLVAGGHAEDAAAGVDRGASRGPSGPLARGRAPAPPPGGRDPRPCLGALHLLARLVVLELCLDLGALKAREGVAQ